MRFAFCPPPLFSNKKSLLRLLVYKLKAVTCRFVPPLRGLLFKNRFEKYTVTPTSNKKFSTRNPAVFLKRYLEYGKTDEYINGKLLRRRALDRDASNRNAPLGISLFSYFCQPKVSSRTNTVPGSGVRE